MDFPLGLNQHRRILREFRDLEDQSEPGWSVEPYYPNYLRKWKLYLQGPNGTPYENGKFQISVVFPAAFPLEPPEFRFITDIFHPNIGLDGYLSIDILNKNAMYRPSVSIRSVLSAIDLILKNPDPASPLCVEAAYLYINKFDSFQYIATSFTRKFAINEEIISSRSVSPLSIETDFVDADNNVDSNHSSNSNKAKWLYKSVSNGAEADDKWQTYSKSEEAALEHSYQAGELIADLEVCSINFSRALQISTNNEVSTVKRIVPIYDTHRRKYKSLEFYRGSSTHEIPIIAECLSNSVKTNLSDVINGILHEGYLRNQHQQAENEVELLKEVAACGSEVIGLRCIHLYTRDSFVHRALNNFLRNQDYSKVSTLGPFFKLLYSHFINFPVEPQSLVVYRGMSLKSSQLRAYKRGTGKRSFRWFEFLSTSKNLNVAETHKGNSLFIIRLQKLYNDGRALDISTLSQFDEEEEVLLRAGVEFSISKYEMEKELYTFYLDAYI